MNLVDELHAIASALESAGVAYAVCGGVAVTMHGATRSTKDIDVLVARADVDRALAAVASLGYDIRALPLVFEEGTARERHVQRVSKIEDRAHMMLDLLIAEGPLSGLLDDRVVIALSRGPISVVSRATLVRMKSLAGRAQDLADIEKLSGGDDA